jgi:FkbM family methyltransferase
MSMWYYRIRSRCLRTILRHALRKERRDDLLRLGTPRADWIIPANLLPRRAVCYCVGLGEEGSFDQGLAQRFEAEVHVFDPTPRAVAYARTTFREGDGITFHPVGLWSHEATLKFYAPRNPRHVSHSIVNLQRTADYFEAPCKSLRALMVELDHNDIDLLKLDIEGAEHAVLGSLVDDDITPAVLCVEFDQPVPLRRLFKTLGELKRAGYILISVDSWNYTFRASRAREKR